MDNFQRAMAYLKNMPAAVSGSGGHGATFQAVLACRRFGLSDGEMWEAMQWFNDNRCSPPWSEKELRHKLASAAAIQQVKKPFAGQTQTARRPSSRVFVPPVLTRPARPAYVGQSNPVVVAVPDPSQPDEWDGQAPDDAYWDFIMCEAEAECETL